MSVTYTYIQKYIGPRKLSSSPSPMLVALNKATTLIYSKISSTPVNRKMGMIISPGFLSLKQSTSNQLIYALLSNHQVVDRTWILGTMNGNTVSQYSLSNNLHHLKVSLNKKTSQPKLNKTGGQATDHRKMIFIISWEGRRPLLRRKRNIKKFMKRIDVLLATIGSSNFSASTYFMGNHQNEADVMWIDESKLNQISSQNLSNNNNSITNAILGDMIEPDPLTGLPSAVSGTINSLKNKNKDEFLSNLLKHTLEETII